MRNERITVTIDPAKGLILGLGYGAHGNLLWVNPKPISDPEINNGWVNYGGDKLWWGPMIDWMAVKGHRLPPDEAMDSDWEVIRQSPDRLTMRSRLSRWVGVRAEREISILPDSSEVVIQNRFIRESPGSQRLQLWTVCQLPPPQWCLLDSNPRPGEPPYRNRRPMFDPTTVTSVVPATHDVIYRPKIDMPNLIGTRGSWIAAIYEDVIVIHHLTPVTGGDYATDVSMQLFSNNDFVELETLSENATPKVGESMEATVRWLVLPRPKDKSDDALAVWIDQQMQSENSPRPAAGAPAGQRP